MKRIMELGLAVVLTIISVFTMITVRGSDMQDESVFIENNGDDSGKPEGTGYIFDDYGKNINIPLEEEKKVETPKNNESSQLDQDSSRRTLERIMAKLEPEMNFSNYSNRLNYSSNPRSYKTNTSNDISKSRVIISKVRNNITFEDQLSLLKIVKRLSLGELNDIKNAIINGTTNTESIKLWTMLRNKLPHDEYKKLENIIAKYE